MRIDRKRNEPIKETQMVSLADIAFLIIFFFLLTSTFMRDKLGIKLPELPRSAKTESAITVMIDKSQQIHLNGQPIGSPTALETELKALLEAKNTPKECEVRIRCEKTLTYTQYKPIYEAVARAGGVIAVMHELKK